MKKVSFSGEILIANKHLANGGPYNWIATYRRDNNRVEVIALDCLVKEQIAGKIKELISVLSEKIDACSAEQPADEVTKSNLEYLKNLDNMLTSGLYQKDIPQDLLRAVHRNFPLVTRENSIYLSGIESIS